MNARSGQTDDRQRVRDASDIVDVVGDVVNLKPKGREFVGLCPFHDDRNPSMYVVPNKQIFHCFVCGASGDVFTFAQKYHGLDFREALQMLADRAGIELTPWRSPAGAAKPESDGPGRSELIAANATAGAFFSAILNHPEHGTDARAIIERRGISPEMVERFAIGASTDRWDGLQMTIAGKGLSERDFIAAGLLKERESGGTYDALRNRLIFPITDQAGRVIAFGGRRIDDDDEPKYLNSPESAIFNKSQTLFGLHQASRAIQKHRTAVVVEGYTDVIACHQAGFEHVVGTLGTALTPGHARVLRRLCDTVVLLFDSDDAGRRAAGRAVEVFFAEPIDVKIAAIGDVSDLKDPDELLSSDGGAELFTRVIDESRELLAYLFDELGERLAGQGIAARGRIIEQWLRQLGTMGWQTLEPIRRRLVLQRLGEVTGLDERTIRSALPGGRSTRSEPAAVPRADEPLDAAETVLGCLLADGSLWLTLGSGERDLIHTDAYRSPPGKCVADAAHRLGADGVNPGFDALVGELDEEAMENNGGAEQLIEAKQWATRLRERIDLVTGQDTERRGHLLGDALRQLRDQADCLTLDTETARSDPAALAAYLAKRRELDGKLGVNRATRLTGE